MFSCNAATASGASGGDAATSHRIILLKTKGQVKRKTKKIRKKRGKSSENFYFKGRNFSSFIEALMENVY